MSNLGQLDALMHKTHIKVLHILSLSKIAHQMWHDHPFSQRNMTTERTVEVGLEMTERLGGRDGQNLKKGGSL